MVSVNAVDSASGAGFGRAGLNLIVKDFKGNASVLTLKSLQSDHTADTMCNRYLVWLHAAASFIWWACLKCFHGNHDMLFWHSVGPMFDSLHHWLF